jgi:hypothetical protein
MQQTAVAALPFWGLSGIIPIIEVESAIAKETIL